MVAPAVHASTPARVTTGSASTPVTTASFNPPANSLLLACAMRVSDTANSGVTISNNGAATTWTRVIKFLDATSDVGVPSGVDIWYALLTSARTGMTVTASPANANYAEAMKLYVITGHDLAAPIGGTASGHSEGTQTIATSGLTIQRASSLGFVVAVDRYDVIAPTSSDTTYDAASGAFWADLSGYKTLGAAGGTATFSLTGGNATDAYWRYATVEIMSPSAIVTPPKANLYRQMRRRVS